MEQAWDDFGLVALAGLLGGLIGIEREIADKPAGLRTHVLVAAAAALLMLVGRDATIWYIQQFGNSGKFEADPTRVLQAIVMGISFLGAGTIIHRSGSSVEGLTTAASVFITTGIGIGVAVGSQWLAIATTLSVVGVLLIAGLMEKWIQTHRDRNRTKASHVPD